MQVIIVEVLQLKCFREGEKYQNSHRRLNQHSMFETVSCGKIHCFHLNPMYIVVVSSNLLSSVVFSLDSNSGKQDQVVVAGQAGIRE